MSLELIIILIIMVKMKSHIQHISLQGMGINIKQTQLHMLAKLVMAMILMI